MARAHVRTVLIDQAGNTIAGQAVNIYQPTTTTATIGSMYDAASGGSTVTNPRTSDAFGVVDVWLEFSQVVDFVWSDAAGEHRVSGHTEGSAPPQENQQHVHPAGNDDNDGLSWETPKETILAAYDALFDLDDFDPLGGVVYIADNSYVGGEVENQGIWLLGENDFVYPDLPPGWRAGGRVDFIGVGGANVQFGKTGSFIRGGQPGGSGWDVTDPLKPAFWLAGTFGGVRIERIFVQDTPIALRAGISSDMSNRACATAHLRVRDCSFDNGIQDPVVRADKAPVVEFGYCFWTYVEGCIFQNQRAGREAAFDFDTDTSAAVLIKPALGQSTLANDIDPSVTSFDVVDGSSFPAGNFTVFINGIVDGIVKNEHVLVATRTGNTFSGCTRQYVFDPYPNNHAAGNDVLQWPQNSSTLVHFNRIISAGGGLKYYKGTSSWSIYVDDWLQEGDFVNGVGTTIWIVNPDGFGSADINDIQTADTSLNGEPVVKIGTGAPAGAIRIGQVSPQTIEGPHFRDVPFGTNAGPRHELAEEGSMGFVGTRFVGRHDASVRAGAPPSVLFTNLAEQDVSLWSALAGDPGPATVATGQRDVYGGTNAATLSVTVPTTTAAEAVSDSDTEFDVADATGFGTPPFRILLDSEVITVVTVVGDTFGGLIRAAPVAHSNGAPVERQTQYELRHPYRANLSLDVGDWIIGGVWCKAEESGLIPGFPSELLIGIGDAVFTSTTNYAIGGLESSPEGGVYAGRWQWLPAYSKIGTITGVGTEMYMSLACGSDASRTFCYPVFCRIPAGTLEDNEVAEMGYHMGTWAKGAAAGQVSLLPSQSLYIPKGFIEGVEIAAPATPAANTYRIYAKDVAGKTGLYVMFADGSEQQIKVQP